MGKQADMKGQKHGLYGSCGTRGLGMTFAVMTFLPCQFQSQFAGREDRE